MLSEQRRIQDILIGGSQGFLENVKKIEGTFLEVDGSIGLVVEARRGVFGASHRKQLRPFRL